MKDAGPCEHRELPYEEVFHSRIEERERNRSRGRDQVKDDQRMVKIIWTMVMVRMVMFRMVREVA